MFDKDSIKKVVLAYSGGLDTSCIVPWLKENYGCEVVTFTANVGQGDDELEGIEQKALNSGACDVVVRDVREEFARDFVFPILRAGAVYEGAYLLRTSIARPLVAKEQIMVAPETGANLPERFAIVLKETGDRFRRLSGFTRHMAHVLSAPWGLLLARPNLA